MNPFGRLSLLHHLLAGGFVVLLAGMLIVGTWVSNDLEQGHLNHLGSLNSLYGNSFVSPHLDSLASSGRLAEADQAALDGLLTGTPLGKQVVSFKVWARDGRVLYSTTPALIGRKFEVSAALASAFAGKVHSKISDLSDPDNQGERERWSRLIETYAPLYDEKTGSIVAVAEFYQTTDDLEQELHVARLRSWIMVITATLAMYLLLAGLIRRASNTIVGQQRELREKVSQLTTLLTQNEQLHERVRRAGARTAALNERFLHRVAADLHDGSGQGLALALMRMETLAEICSNCPTTVAKERTVGDEFHTLHSALQVALRDLRAVCAGLHLPEIEQLSLADTARRAVNDYERTTGVAVALAMEDPLPEASLPVKITLYRVLQESLANALRHGGGVAQRVALKMRDGQLQVEVSDSGKGFDPRAAGTDGHLGLAGMRERVEILGGTFGVQSAPGCGTVVRATLPTALLETDRE